MDERDDARRAARIELLLQGLAELPDPQARERAEELVGMLLGLYGDALARMLELAGQAGGITGGDSLIRAFAGDELVGSLLLLHGLHPDDIETRIRRALDGVRPYLRSHGGNVELLGVAEGTAHLRLQGSCHGCPSSTVTLKLAIEEAIYAAAPDLEGLDVEGVVDAPAPVPLITLARAPRRRSGSGERSDTEEHAGAWAAVTGVLPLADGAIKAKTVRQRALIFCCVSGTYYAYANRCAGCGGRLDGGRLDGALLTCPACGRRFDLRVAGRGVDEPELFLAPAPLLVEAGMVKVALPAVETAAPVREAAERTAMAR